jgi:hypothetical protein
MSGRSANKFGESAIHTDPGNTLAGAQVLVALSARFTFATGPVDPGHSNSVAGPHPGDRSALVDDATYDFVSENEGLFDDWGELRPVTVGDVEIGVANSTSFHSHQNLSGGRLRVSCPLNDECLLEFVEYSSLHGWHKDPLRH